MTPVTSKKVYSDFDDFPTFAKVNEELVDQTSNKDLKPLRIRNLKKIGHLNINSIRNKVNFFAHQVQGNIPSRSVFIRRLQCFFPL